MELIALRVSSGMLTDVRRRYLYVSVTLFGRTAWAQYWPRPIARKRFLTAGVR